MHVKYILGHRSVESTQIYIHIEKGVFVNSTDNFYCKTAKTVEEAIKLIDAGFEKHDEMNGIHIYRKRK